MPEAPEERATGVRTPHVKREQGKDDAALGLLQLGPVTRFSGLESSGMVCVVQHEAQGWAVRAVHGDQPSAHALGSVDSRTVHEALFRADATPEAFG